MTSALTTEFLELKVEEAFPELPPIELKIKILQQILQQSGSCIASVLNRSFKILNLDAMNVQWNEIKARLKSDPVIAAHIDSLGLDNPSIKNIPRQQRFKRTFEALDDPSSKSLSGQEKFKRLFEAMLHDLGNSPKSIRDLSRFSPECYLQLSQEIQQINASLESDWPPLHELFLNAANDFAEDASALPQENANADVIKAWLNCPGAYQIQELPEDPLQ